MDIVKTMSTNLILVMPALMILVLFTAVINRYPGLVKIKRPMGFELTVDGRFKPFSLKQKIK